MFDRFLTYAKARRALKQGQPEQALRLVADPAIAGERRADDIRERAARRLIARVDERLGAGLLDAAEADLRALRERMPDFEGLDGRAEKLEEERAHISARRQTADQLRGEADAALRAGDLKSARELLDRAQASAPEAVELQTLAARLEGCEKQEALVIEQLEAAVQQGDAASIRRIASTELGQRKLATLADRAALTRVLALDLEKLSATAGINAHWLEVFACDRDRVPEIAREPECLSCLATAREELTRDLEARVREGSFEGALELWHRSHKALREDPDLARQRIWLESLEAGLDAEREGDLSRALTQLESVQVATGGKSLARKIKQLKQIEGEAKTAIQCAREAVDQGRLLAAREGLQAFEEDTGMVHRAVRNELDLLTRQAEERRSRLSAARAAVAEGRLAAASVSLVGLVGDDSEGQEARLLLQDVRRRSDQAAAGLAQVRRAAHGQDSCSVEGLRHCIARLDAIRDAQADLPGVGELRAALEAEICGLEQLEKLEESIVRRERDAAEASLEAFGAAVPGMLDESRLLARRLERMDQLASLVETQMAQGDVKSALSWLGLLDRHAPAEAALDRRRARLRQELEQSEAGLELGIGEVEEALSNGHVEIAEQRLEGLRERWPDAAEVRRLELRFEKLRRQAQVADEADGLAEQGDLVGAARRIEELGPVPGALRTRIFDMKKSLAKAQGLDQGFVLRVDEGGEFLVLRDDLLSIGNLRERKARLCLLASLSGEHAQLRRSMSFHGGLKDSIEALDGRVEVNGQAVAQQVLQSGDRIRLGKSLEFEYLLPSKRSLSALLTLGSGFQAAGADRVILLKDRGRDGRLLLGAAKDAHVRVSHDGPEVEIFAAADGQIRVRFAGKGEMDGRPFSGEHPITAGAWVNCAGLGFVLQPWTGSRS